MTELTPVCDVPVGGLCRVRGRAGYAYALRVSATHGLLVRALTMSGLMWFQRNRRGIDECELIRWHNTTAPCEVVATDVSPDADEIELEGLARLYDCAL